MNKIAAIAWGIMLFALFGHPFFLIIFIIYVAIAVLIPIIKPEWKKFFFPDRFS